MDVRLRPAGPADSTFVFDVRREAFHQYVELAEGWNEDTELERHAERLKRLRVRVITAESANVGYMATRAYPATDDFRSSLYLHQLMLLPAFQSKGIFKPTNIVEA